MGDREIQLGQTYTIELKGRTTEVVVLAHKLADQDVLWSTSQREAVLLKLPSGRQITRHPKALTPLKDQLDLFTDRFHEGSEESNEEGAY